MHVMRCLYVLSQWVCAGMMREKTSSLLAPVRIALSLRVTRSFPFPSLSELQRHQEPLGWGLLTCVGFLVSLNKPCRKTTTSWS